MNIVTEPHISGKPIIDKPRARPVRKLRWFIIVGLLLAVLVGALVGFNAFRSHMIAQFFANNKPPPTTVSVAEAKTEVEAEGFKLGPVIETLPRQHILIYTKAAAKGAAAGK